jgi:hypothetical protein
MKKGNGFGVRLVRSPSPFLNMVKVFSFTNFCFALQIQQNNVF